MSPRLAATLAPALLAAAPAAHAEATRGPASVAPPAATATPVIGGDDVASGRWRDVAAVLFDGEFGCTGTLIAPDVVLTAGHCVDSSLDAVLIGTNSLSTPSAGERIDVLSQHEYPNSWNTFDIALLKLAHPSTIAPRAIATGWARLDIVDGATVALVGYGAIDRNANQYVPELQEATTVLTDADCTRSAGCNAGARPAGELGAGGMGIDTCPGDSGGPLYLMTSYGEFLAGVTSRGYDDNAYYCSEGGIYERPDAVVDWMEAIIGGPLVRGPEPTAGPLEAVNGGAAQTTIDAGDPLATAHTFEITGAPAHGRAAVDAAGRLRVCTDAGFVGDDEVTVRITDAASPSRSLEATFAIVAMDGAGPADCSLEFDDEDEGGCCSTGRGSPTGTAALVGLVGIALVGRRRRRR